jgi:hypothetical protein
MQKFRNNFFYTCAIVGFIAWIVNTLMVVRICGVTHPILIRELFYLGILIYIYYYYARKIFDSIETYPFNGRAQITKGDVLAFRFLGPWFSLFSQFVLTLILLLSVHGKLFTDQRREKACEFQRRFR